MKNFKKLIAAATIAGVLGVTGAAYAAGATTPASIVSSLTGQTIEQVTAERAAGKTYGAIANAAGKLDEFKSEILAQRKAILDQKVKDGILTQAQADAAYNAMQANQAICDGTGSARLGLGNGTGQGLGLGLGAGQGLGMGAGRGKGGGRGMNAGCRLVQ